MSKEEGPEKQLDQETEVARLVELVHQLDPYYQRHLEVAGLNPEPSSLSHPDRMREIGYAIRSLRRQAGLSREDFAQKLNIDPLRLRAFEIGLIPTSDMPSDFPENVSRHLREALHLGEDFSQPNNPNN